MTRSEHFIERLGHHGDGIASGPVFAPLSLPGETVSGVLEGDRLRDLRVVTPSDHRVKAPCAHFKTCGGCGLQHASDAFVQDWKVDVVRQALAAVGVESDFRPIKTSPPRSRRRAVISARRTKKGAMAGFHMRASSVIAEISTCDVLHPDLMPSLDIARVLAVLGASRKGELSVTATLSAGGLDVAVSGGKPLDGAFQAQLGQEAQRLKVARLTWDGEVIATLVPPVQRFGVASVVPPPGAFLQATQDGEAALVSAVSEIVGDAKSVFDLFAGCGTFSLPLAKTAEVHAIEGEGAMMKALDRGWREATGLKRVSVETRDLFRNPVMAEDLRCDAVVIDPPRAGAQAQAAELARASLQRIAYVSCNPVTFARDARVLVDAGYRLEWVQVVDQFRWSSHVELVGAFTR
ncbi:class I SAM-dependent RNA methyltransferase [Cognatishimia sp.]|uniref:class I SAM-dependent RNA methyltransferase n=1 Tax=Cognatishimia sp. TaxID=2211648 RepID=UPI0035195BA9